jgi:hypothetical protein
MHTESPREKERPGGQAGLFNMAEFDTAGLRLEPEERAKISWS